MSTTTLQRMPRLTWDVPTGILVHHPREAPRGAERVWPERSGSDRPTYLHPAVVITAAGGYAWMLLVFWVVLGGVGYTAFTLLIASLISCVMLGLLAACGHGGRTVAPWQRPWRSFGEFLRGDVQVWGARMGGREAFVQLAGLAWSLAALATAFGVIIALSRG